MQAVQSAEDQISPQAQTFTDILVPSLKVIEDAIARTGLFTVREMGFGIQGLYLHRDCTACGNLVDIHDIRIDEAPNRETAPEKFPAFAIEFARQLDAQEGYAWDFLGCDSYPVDQCGICDEQMQD